MLSRRFACVVVAIAGASAPALASLPGVSIEIEDEEDEDEDTPPAPSAPTPAAGVNPRASEGPVAVPAAGANPRAADVPGAVPTSEAAATAPTTVAGDAEAEALRRELAAVQARLAALEEARRDELAQKTASQAGGVVRTGGRLELPPTATGFGPSLGVAAWGVRLSGYVQAQYQWSRLSEDQIQQGGAELNQSRFMVRRGRVRLSGDWKWVAFDLELDGSTTRGPFVGVRQASASFVWRNPDATRPPYLMVTAGLTEVPFGWELRLGQREMVFMERTRGSLAFFPGPVDVGVRVRGGLGPFRYDLAVMNGTPLDDRAGGRGLTGDPTRAPDYIGRFGFDARPRRHAIAGGVSLLYGTGFHRGQDASKGRVEWVDLNENGVIDSGELTAVPGMAATPSLTFRRWAVGADFQVALRSKAGWSQVWLEGTLASNLDRDFLVADPIAAGADLREVHAYAAFLQDLFGRAVLGARYEFYNPNSDLLDRRRGVFVPASAAIHAISPLVGAVLPPGLVPHVRGRLVFQYDVVLDALGRDARGVPSDLKNDQFIVRVQAEF